MAKHGSPGQLALFESPKASRRRRYRPTYDHYSVEAIRRTNEVLDRLIAERRGLKPYEGRGRHDRFRERSAGHGSGPLRSRSGQVGLTRAALGCIQSLSRWSGYERDALLPSVQECFPEVAL